MKAIGVQLRTQADEHPQPSLRRRAAGFFGAALAWAWRALANLATALLLLAAAASAAETTGAAPRGGGVSTRFAAVPSTNFSDGG